MTTHLIEQVELFSETEQYSLEFSSEELAGIESQLEYDLESVTFEDVRTEMETYFLESIPEPESVNQRALQVFTPLIQKVVQNIANNPQMRAKLQTACRQGTNAVAGILLPILSNMLPKYLSWMVHQFGLPVVRTLGRSICQKVGASSEALASLECGCSRRPPRSTPNHNADASNYEKRVIELTNQERRKRGLSPLQHNDKLADAAQKYTRHMASNNFLSHTGKDGSTLGSRVQATGYRYGGLAENIANGQRTPDQVVQAWMKSPGHRRNILNPGLREIGVGYYKNYWTQVFGTPR